MRENGLQVRPLRRFVRTTDSAHEIEELLLPNQRFTIAKHPLRSALDFFAIFIGMFSFAALTLGTTMPSLKGRRHILIINA
jgi:hypothetical protein